MQTTRRSFLRYGSLAVGGTLAFPNEMFAFNKTKGLLGLQLYCVRDDMDKNPLDTLEQLAKMGYKNVEHANYVKRKFYGYSPAEFKKILDDLGLKMPSGHTVMGTEHWDDATNDFTDDWKYTIEDAAFLGQEFVISPYMDDKLRKDYDALLKFLDRFNKCGELCQKSNMKFGYHNHDFEFRESLNGQKIYDIILEHTDPALVVQQLDIGNMHGGGGKPMEVLNKYPGRFVSLHVKDEIKSTKGDGQGEMEGNFESTILGKGIMNIKQVLDLAGKTGGTKHFIIEQESYQGKTPLECMKEDLKIMKNWGY